MLGADIVFLFKCFGSLVVWTCGCGIRGSTGPTVLQVERIEAFSCCSCPGIALLCTNILLHIFNHPYHICAFFSFMPLCPCPWSLGGSG
jgi:hypothetical protein